MTLRAWRIPLIILVGIGLGLAWNTFSGRGIALRNNVMIGPEDEIVSVTQAKERLDKGALFLDARQPAWYEMGHIPGALSLPEDDFDKQFAAIEAQIRGRLDLVVYCSGFGCEASHNVAGKLKERGIPAAILQDGWPAWTDAQYPVTKGPRP